MIVRTREVYQAAYDSLSSSTYSVTDFVNLSFFVASSDHGRLTINEDHSDVGPQRSLFPTK